MKLLYDLQQSPSDNVSRERLGDRICDMLSCISAHGFCSRLLSLQAVVDTIRDGKWARLEALAKQAVDTKVRAPCGLRRTMPAADVFADDHGA